MRQFQYGAPHSSGVACDPVIWCILLGLLYLRHIFIRKGRRCNYYHENERRRPIESSNPAFVNPASLHYSYHTILSNRNITIQGHWQLSSLFLTTFFVSYKTTRSSSLYHFPVRCGTRGIGQFTVVRSNFIYSKCLKMLLETFHFDLVGRCQI